MLRTDRESVTITKEAEKADWQGNEARSNESTSHVFTRRPLPHWPVDPLTFGRRN